MEANYLFIKMKQLNNLKTHGNKTVYIYRTGPD